MLLAAIFIVLLVAGISGILAISNNDKNPCMRILYTRISIVSFSIIIAVNEVLLLLDMEGKMLTISYTLLVAICLIALMTVMTVFGILSISNKIKNKKSVFYIWL